MSAHHSGWRVLSVKCGSCSSRGFRGPCAAALFGPRHLRSLRTVPDPQIGSNAAAGHRKGQPPPRQLVLLHLSAQLPDHSVLSVSPGSQLGISKSTSLRPSGFFIEFHHYRADMLKSKCECADFYLILGALFIICSI